MQDLSRSLPADRFQMLTIPSNDRPAVAEKFVKAIGLTNPVQLDPVNRVDQAYGRTGVPEGL
jgi:hypothetical protein